MIPFMGACLGGAGFSLPIRAKLGQPRPRYPLGRERGWLGASVAPRRNPPVINARGVSAVGLAAGRLPRRPANEEHPGYKEERHWLRQQFAHFAIAPNVLVKSPRKPGPGPGCRPD